MPLPVSFSEKDMRRGIVVIPAWYRVKIDAVGQKPSKDGGSINYIMEGTIIRNADNGDIAFTGVPIDWNFNSKAMGFAVGFFKSFGVEVQAGQRYDFEAAAGKELDIFIENGEYNGQINNKIHHKYRPAAA